MADDLLITVDDVRLAGHCVSGLREWFERHNLDFNDFIKNGIRESVLTEHGDALSARVVRLKKEREGI